MTTQTIHVGDCRAKLAELPAESVHCVVTSPPYWQQRTYGGGDAELGAEALHDCLGWATGDRCGECFVCHLVDVFRGVKRVLRGDGVVFLNLGDSFQNSNLALIPYRVALALQAGGWWIRQAIVWCLAGETSMVCKIDSKLWEGTIQELASVFETAQLVEVSTMGKGFSKHWVKVLSVKKTGEKDVSRITLTNGAQVFATDEHQFPARSNTMNKRNQTWTYTPNSVRTQDLTPGMYLYQNVRLDYNLPHGTDTDYRDGYWIGFYMAEGFRVSTHYETVRLVCGHGDAEILKKFGRWGIPLTVSDRRPGRLDVNLRIRHGGAEWRDKILDHVEGRSAYTKHLKQNVFNRSEQFLSGILDGFLDGDGHWDALGQRWRVGMTAKNKKLVNQMEVICRILGLEFRRESEKDVEAFGGVHRAIRFNINELTANYGGKGKIVNGDMVTREIRSIEPAGTMDVYDIEVEPLYAGGPANQWESGKGESSDPKKAPYNHLYFLGNGVWTHNCKGMSFCPTYSGSCMPESVRGWRYERCRVKISKSERASEKSYHAGAYGEKPQGARDGRDFKDHSTEYTDCPGCPKCADNDGYVLRRGSWRPTTGHETVWMLAKSQRYFCDGEAVREPSADPDRTNYVHGAKLDDSRNDIERRDFGGGADRNPRSVWTINPGNFPGSHFATFPEALVRPMILAGTSEKVCAECGAPWARVVERRKYTPEKADVGQRNVDASRKDKMRKLSGSDFNVQNQTTAAGHRPTCTCNASTLPATVLDPFAGAGTTLLVAAKLGRDGVGIELLPKYAQMARDRIEGEVGRMFCKVEIQ